MTTRGAREERRQKLAEAHAEEGAGGIGQGAAARRGDGVVHLARRDAACEQRRHEGAAAHPDVEVEIGHAAVEQVLERAQAADLVDGAGDAAARADEGATLDLPSATRVRRRSAPPRLGHRASEVVRRWLRRRPRAPAPRPGGTAVAVDLARSSSTLRVSSETSRRLGMLSATRVPRTVSSTTRPRSFFSRCNRPCRAESWDSIWRAAFFCSFCARARSGGQGRAEVGGLEAPAGQELPDPPLRAGLGRAQHLDGGVPGLTDALARGLRASVFTRARARDRGRTSSSSPSLSPSSLLSCSCVPLKVAAARGVGAAPAGLRTWTGARFSACRAGVTPWSLSVSSIRRSRAWTPAWGLGHEALGGSGDVLAEGQRFVQRETSPRHQPGHDALRLVAGARRPGGDRATSVKPPALAEPRRMRRLSTWWGMSAVRCLILQHHLGEHDVGDVRPRCAARPRARPSPRRRGAELLQRDVAPGLRVVELAVVVAPDETLGGAGETAFMSPI